MDTRAVSALILATTLAVFASVSMSAASLAARPAAVPLQTVTVESNGDMKIERGMYRGDLSYAMECGNRAELTPDVWFFSGFHSSSGAAIVQECGSVVVTFANGIVVDLQLVNQTAVASIAANLKFGSSALTPPSYPDAAHVPNGCHLSAIRYLSRYLSDFPGERGEPLVINMVNADRSRKMHTMALISWHGQAWCRDEYFGAFALGCPLVARPNLARLSARAEACYQEHARMLIHMAGMTQRREASEDLSSEDRFHEVTQAAWIIPFPTTIFWVRSGREEFPVAFFRPGGRQVAVYDPMNGTSVAKCSILDDAKVVSLVAARLGYRSDGVRREAFGSGGTFLVAANDP